jgi:hypothetical protein
MSRVPDRIAIGDRVVFSFTLNERGVVAETIMSGTVIGFQGTHPLEAKLVDIKMHSMESVMGTPVPIAFPNQASVFVTELRAMKNAGFAK